MRTADIIFVAVMLAPFLLGIGGFVLALRQRPLAGALLAFSIFAAVSALVASIFLERGGRDWIELLGYGFAFLAAGVSGPFFLEEPGAAWSLSMGVWVLLLFAVLLAFFSRLVI